MSDSEKGGDAIEVQVDDGNRQLASGPSARANVKDVIQTMAEQNLRMSRLGVHKESKYWTSTSLPGYLAMVLLAYKAFIPMMRTLFEDDAIKPWGIEGSAETNMERTATVLGLGIAMMVTSLGPAVITGLLQFMAITIGWKYPGFVDRVMKTIENTLDWLLVEGYEDSPYSEILPLTPSVTSVSVPVSIDTSKSALAREAALVSIPRAVTSVVDHMTSLILPSLLVYFFGDDVARNEEAEWAKKCLEDPNCQLPPDMPQKTERYAFKFGHELDAAVIVAMAINYIRIVGSQKELGTTSVKRFFPHKPGREAGFNEKATYYIRCTAAISLKGPDWVLRQLRTSRLFKVPRLHADTSPMPTNQSLGF